MNCRHSFPWFIIIIFICCNSAWTQIVFHSADEAAEFAVQHSDSYVLEKLNAEVSLINAKYAIQQFLPTFNVSWSEDDTIKYSGTDSRSKSVRFSIAETIFDGGKRKLSYDMARTDSLYAYKSYEQKLSSFKSDIISQYYAYITQCNTVKIKKDLVSNAAEQLEILKSEYTLGMALETDYLEYLIQYKQLQDEENRNLRAQSTLLRKFKTALGLPPEAAVELTETTFSENADEQSLEPFINFIWNMIKNNNPELQKLGYSLSYSRKQLAYSKLLFIPEIKLDGGVSFSGTAYPLTQPSYSAKLSISFADNPFFPLTVTNGYGFGSRGLNNVNNGASSEFAPQPVFFQKIKSSEIALYQMREQKKSKEQALYETVFDAIASHDDSLASIQVIKETLALEERRLEVSRKEVDKGEMKRIDYLKALIEFSEEKTKLLQSQSSLEESSRQLEILLGIPFGELKNVCKTSI